MIRPHDPSRGAHFAAVLLRAMGLAGSAAAAVACGGIAVIEDDDDGSGGSGATGNVGPGSGPTGSVGSGSVGSGSVGSGSVGSGSGGASGSASVSGVTVGTSSGSGGFTCDAVPGPGEQLEYACFVPQGSGCPASGSALVYQQMSAALSGLGCGGFSISDVPCGPDPTVPENCCYVAQGYVLECGGRPFVVQGSARTADPAERSDWSADLAPDLSGLDGVVRSGLARAWTRDALDEHASVASFARFALELLAVGAPADLVRLAQRAMGDEIRHAEICFGLASAYAGADVGPSALAMAGGLAMRTTLAEVAAAAVREGCVGETVAAFIAGGARDQATDPVTRAALAVIARDESAHAALAWRFVAWALRQGGVDVARAVEHAFAAALASPPTGRDAGLEDPRAASHGQLSEQARRELSALALAQVVRPCSEALALAQTPRGIELVDGEATLRV